MENERDIKEKAVNNDEMNQQGQILGGRGIGGIRMALQRRLVLGIVAGALVGIFLSSYYSTDVNAGALIGALFGAVAGFVSYMWGS